MGKRVVVAGGLAAAVAGGAAVLVIGLRRRSPVVVDTVRRFARDVGNPRVLATAGRTGSNTSVLHHVGRRSGASYRTPVTAMATADGFVIALPYGPDTDWLKNVLAAGRATVQHEGRSYPVDRPAVVPSTQALADFPPGARRALRWLGVQECVRLQHAPEENPGDAPAVAADPSGSVG